MANKPELTVLPFCYTELLIHARIGIPGSESQTQRRLQAELLNSCTDRNYWKCVPDTGQTVGTELLIHALIELL